MTGAAAAPVRILDVNLANAQDVVLDARVPAVVLAGILFAFRVPFIVVLVAAAVTAALLRAYAGMG